MSAEFPYRVLVADDEPHSRRYVCALVERDSRFQVAEVCDSGHAAIAKVQDNPVDVMFLDIQMPGLDGFAVIDAIGDIKPLIVFVTAFGEHALRAFEYQAFDYVKKPIDPTRFASVLDRLCRRLNEGRSDTSQLPVPDARVNATTSAKTHIPIKKVLNAVRQDVLYQESELQVVESSGNYVSVRVNNETFLVRTTLEHFCQDLDPAIFVRVHRSFVVNIQSVRRMQYGKFGSAELYLADGYIVPVSRGRRSEVAKILRNCSECSEILEDDGTD